MLNNAYFSSIINNINNVIHIYKINYSKVCTNFVVFYITVHTIEKI